MSIQEQIDFMKAECRFLLSQEMECANRRTKLEKALHKLQDEQAIKRAVGRELSEQDVTKITNVYMER